MSLLLDFARRIRHSPGLRSAEGLWRYLRTPFHRLMDPLGRGVPLELAHGHRIRLPADLTGCVDDWKRYEPESVEWAARWIAAHPDALVLDVGCAIGIFTALALHTADTTDVVAFDADLASLQATRRVGDVAPRPSRLRLVHGLVSDQHRSNRDLASAVSATATALAMANLGGAGATTRYVCIEDPMRAQLPEYTLDGLFAQSAASPRSTLLKCDVEGAEALVLKGARRWLETTRPIILLSVHPPALQKLGNSVKEVEDLLRDAGYKWQLIARDHEEHWWAEPLHLPAAAR